MPDLVQTNGSDFRKMPDQYSGHNSSIGIVAWWHVQTDQHGRVVEEANRDIIGRYISVQVQF
jgi:hypothetical protein